MSKFTKALEKIQQDREKIADAFESEARNLKSLDAIDDIPASWDRGIPRISNTKPDTRIVTYHFPNSLISEQYRILRTNLKEHLGKTGGKVIMVSSSINGEGKTVSSTNLALSLAELDHCKVALIDADLRRGKVADYLGLGNHLEGLSNFLGNGLAYKQVMVRNSIENLYIIPRGALVKNPSELIISEKFRVLLSELRNHFDYIVIDAPPIMATADASILGREVDGVLMVIQSGRTPKTVIAHAHHLFRQSGANMLGYVLTNVEFQSAEYRYYYSYYNEEDDKLSDFKKKAKFYLGRLRNHIEKAEQSFNSWWEKKILKHR